jgi:A/G-specific adenine glycosylase
VFAHRLLAWFDLNGRHDLPWQKDITPYRVWVSEIMLQQTQVAAVIPYFERFMTRFPTVSKLAAANVDEVLNLWTGLGYYARARNLHKAAQQVMEQHDGQIPQTLVELTMLTGIGRSTAGAILSIAFGQRATILDGNVKRLLTRLAAIDSPPSASREQQLWQLAECLTPDYRHADYTQAIMDMGATLCRRSTPECNRCPFQDVCLGHQAGVAPLLPVGKRRKPLPEKTTFMLLLKNPDGRIWLEQRPPTGLWGGLWCLPQIDNMKQLDGLLVSLGLDAKEQQTLMRFRHTFSHFHLDITPVLLAVRLQTQVADRQGLWTDAARLASLGLAAPVKRLLLETLTRQTAGKKQEPT